MLIHEKNMCDPYVNTFEAHQLSYVTKISSLNNIKFPLPINFLNYWSQRPNVTLHRLLAHTYSQRTL